MFCFFCELAVFILLTHDGVSSAAQARGGQRQQLSVALQLFDSKNGERLHCFLPVILCHQPQLNHETLQERKKFTSTK
jgi:hypothetical protein